MQLKHQDVAGEEIVGVGDHLLPSPLQPLDLHQQLVPFLLDLHENTWEVEGRTGKRQNTAGSRVSHITFLYLFSSWRSCSASDPAASNSAAIRRFSSTSRALSSDVCW